MVGRRTGGTGEEASKTTNCHVTRVVRVERDTGSDGEMVRRVAKGGFVTPSCKPTWHEVSCPLPNSRQRQTDMMKETSHPRDPRA